ncbi:Arylsulfatase A [Cyclobacterium xiamenense]|uniref:Arylsulfatase A n=1 Tax=Cyclobacterium xiamenense TaxID=1297121 RepID=A0A1H7BKU7_9BACT|nr:sulfatase [Cyclobacterium xiamenense]SEJ77534.1 Arylsulfatase A [Cyclobacterium xiamenense]
MTNSLRQFFFFLFLLPLVSQAQPREEKPPNILFILVDDLGYHDLGFTGSSFYETPNIDKLASEGMVFTNAYAASPVCSPSRAAIMTGKYPARLDLTDYIPGNRHYGPHPDQKLASHPFKLFLDPEETTLAEAFKSNGYATFFAGKWHLGEKEMHYPENHGFEVKVGGNATGHPAGGYFSPYANPQLPDGPEGEYLTDRLTEETIQFITKKREKPFFALLSYYTVHLPLQGKEEKVRKYKEKRRKIVSDGASFDQQGKTYFKNSQDVPTYAAMVESLDDNIGRLMRALAEKGLAENTLVVFTSDNGGMASSNLAEQIPTSNAPLRTGKGYLYEGGIRVPLVFRWAENIEPGSSCAYPVTGTDFYPTVLDMAGLQTLPDQHQDGISLKPLLAGEKLDKRPLFWYFPHYSGGLGGRPSAAIREGTYKLVYFFESNQSELYDLETDRAETSDLSASLPKIRNRLHKKLHRWMGEMNVHLPYPNPFYQPDNL